MLRREQQEEVFPQLSKLEMEDKAMIYGTAAEGKRERGIQPLSPSLSLLPQRKWTPRQIITNVISNLLSTLERERPSIIRPS